MHRRTPTSPSTTPSTHGGSPRNPAPARRRLGLVAGAALGVATITTAIAATVGLTAMAQADETPSPTPALVVLEAPATPASSEVARERSSALRASAQAERASAKNLEAELQRIREAVVRRALKQVGDDYAAGAEGPDAFDCSGFTLFAWQAGGVKLPHYSLAQYRVTQRVSLKNAVPGDLAFYFENGAHHVALYIGNGKVVHASDYGIGVVIGKVKGTTWTDTHFTGMGRVKVKV